MEAQRCYANNVFIRQLQETAEAIEVTKMLRDELIPFSSQEKAQAAELVDLSSFTDAFSKIKAISHLFSEKAMAEFAQLEGIPLFLIFTQPLSLLLKLITSKFFFIPRQFQTD